MITLITLITLSSPTTLTTPNSPITHPDNENFCQHTHLRRPALVGRILDRTDTPFLRVKRLLRLQIWSSVFFCVAAFFVWFSNTTQDWLAFTLAGGAVLCYVSIALPFVQKKAMSEAHDKSEK